MVESASVSPLVQDSPAWLAVRGISSPWLVSVTHTFHRAHRLKTQAHRDLFGPMVAMGGIGRTRFPRMERDLMQRVLGSYRSSFSIAVAAVPSAMLEKTTHPSVRVVICTDWKAPRSLHAEIHRLIEKLDSTDALIDLTLSTYER